MNQMKTFWDRKYSEVDQLWGVHPKSTLVKYKSLIPSNGKVLDLGIGEGRNAFYFSSLGYEVEGVDISESAIQRCNEWAEKAELRVKTTVCDLREYQIEENSYSLIILSNVLPFFHDEEIEEIIQKAKAGLIEGGLIYINAFDVNDPSFEKSKQTCKEVSKNTFYRPKTDSHMHYFTSSELKDYFHGYTPITLAETYLLDLAHGEPHYHGTIEVLMKKNEVD